MFSISKIINLVLHSLISILTCHTLWIFIVNSQSYNLFFLLFSFTMHNSEIALDAHISCGQVNFVPEKKSWLYPWSFTWNPGSNLTLETWKQIISGVVCHTSRLNLTTEKWKQIISGVVCHTSWLNLTTEKWKQVISAVTSQPAKQNFLHYIPAYHIISSNICP